MQRQMVICLAICALGVACCVAQSQEHSDTSTATEITALQQKRIELLQQRVSQIESAAQVGLMDRQDVIRPRMDLINARLDYAQSSVEKRKLLTELLGEFDKLIQSAEAALQAPAPPPQPGRQRNTHLKASSELLLLKSERIRIQISRDVLD